MIVLYCTWSKSRLRDLPPCLPGGSIYRMDGVDVAQETERNQAVARHSWARQHTWLLLSLSPFPVGYTLHPLCTGPTFLTIPVCCLFPQIYVHLGEMLLRRTLTHFVDVSPSIGAQSPPPPQRHSKTPLASLNAHSAPVIAPQRPRISRQSLAESEVHSFS